ncbi:MAG: hypothetical protein J6P61_00900 [Erysipelotrichaceae bacterium]|nr:hypothetical protein [Erysipelotrichaceae bacterium]
MEIKVEVQLYEKNVKIADVKALVIKDMQSNGIDLADVDTLDIYYKPGTGSIYYVATTIDKKIYGVGNRPLHI